MAQQAGYAYSDSPSAATTYACRVLSPGWWLGRWAVKRTRFIVGSSFLQAVMLLAIADFCAS
ncbi:hypothetical protein KCP75_22250 [Salmonella enterica subsp. enterica]|nr:hypothetical protein KCP75_22250 [Salmonella enterica subsp. enterica]